LSPPVSNKQKLYLQDKKLTHKNNLKQSNFIEKPNVTFKQVFKVSDMPKSNLKNLYNDYFVGPTHKIIFRIFQKFNRILYKKFDKYGNKQFRKDDILEFFEGFYTRFNEDVEVETLSEKELLVRERNAEIFYRPYIFKVLKLGSVLVLKALNEDKDMLNQRIYFL